MKSPWFILVGGLALGLIAFGASYFAGSARSCCDIRSENAELAWLQKEFQISDAEFARVSNLHEAYQIDCADRCERIDVKNAELQKLLAAANTVTPEIETALRETAQLRAECHKAMLQHFYEVSRTMPPDQGKRYLAWVTARTLGSSHMAMTSDSPATTHESGHK